MRLNPRRPRLSGRVRLSALGVAGLLAGYMALVAWGGGWQPRFDDRFAWQGDSPLLFAHRGAAVGVPENSEASLAQARTLGFRALEVDVRKTRDGTLVLFHDKSVRRMLGLDAELRELTLEQLRRHRLLFEGRETVHGVITLRHALQQLGRSMLFYLDVKVRSFDDADQVAALIEELGLLDRTIVASVDPLFVAYLEHRHPRVNTALERFDFSQVWLYQLTPARWKPDYLAGLARKVSPSHVAWLQEQGLVSKRIVFGLDAALYGRMMRFGIGKAIVAYDPALHAEALASGPGAADRPR